MASAPPVSLRVWVEPGCTRCKWCQNLMPAVFVDGPSGSLVKGEARTDGKTCPNAAGQAPLKPGLLDPASDAFLDFVADGCPAQVIKVRR